MDAKTLIKAGLDNINRELDRKLGGLTQQELQWQPKPDANSIGLILFHMARAEDHLVTFGIQGKTQIWESERWYFKLKKDINDSGGHYTPEQYQAFVVPDLEDLMGYYSAVRKQTLEYLNSLTSEKLDAKVDLPPMGPPPVTTSDGKTQSHHKPPFEPIVGSVLFFNAVHLLNHVGEISYIRGLIRGMDK